MTDRLTGGTYLSHSGAFYRSVLHIAVTVALQNIINYSVNMADNIMLGAFSQAALSGSACVNQIFFLITCISTHVCSAFTVIGSQYWGRDEREPICRLAGVALKLSFLVGAVFFALMALFPDGLVRLFTDDEAIIEQGAIYMSIIKYTMIPYCISTMLMEMLRCVETVRISFILSCISLAINVVLNYALIFGRLGCPELGAAGAAWATLAARIVELAVLVWFVWRRDDKLHLFRSDFLGRHTALRKKYYSIAVTLVFSGFVWAIASPVQTAILGHVSSDAIAANSVATTFYNYLKVVVTAMSSASVVLVGKAVGEGDLKEVRARAHSLELITVLTGVVMALLLFILRRPLLSFYTLSPEAMVLSDSLIRLMCVIMVFMAYQAPMLFGILRGAGDAAFGAKVNVIFIWIISIPLALLSAFVWHWGVVGIVLCIQSDQILKCIPAFLRFHCTDHWIKKLTTD